MQKPKVLVVFYSRDSSTEMLANVARALHCAQDLVAA
jgi:hypothetical protein